MIALVQALLLTVSPSLMLNLSSSDYWQSVAEHIEQCGVPNTENIWYFQIFIPIWNLLTASIVSECGGLIYSIFYFFFRPKGKENFSKWWNRGYYGVSILAFTAITSVVCTMLLMVYFLCYLMIPDQQICKTMEAIDKTGYPIALSAFLTNALYIAAFIFFFVTVLMVYLFA